MFADLLRPRLIVGALPVTLTNGTTADATQVMSDLNWIVNQVNAGAAASGSNADITSMTALTAITQKLTLGSNLAVTGGANVSGNFSVGGTTMLGGAVDFANAAVNTANGGANRAFRFSNANNGVFSGTAAWGVNNQADTLNLLTVANNGSVTTGSAQQMGSGTLNLASNLFINGTVMPLIGPASESVAGSIQIATSSGIISGASALLAVTPARLLSAQQFTGTFISGQQAITSAGQLVIPHGLGRRPIEVTGKLICTAGGGEAGYTQGQDTPTPLGALVTTGAGVSVITDATNLTVRFATAAGAFIVIHATTGTPTSITNGNWALVLIAKG